jgi:hypothetical protein
MRFFLIQNLIVGSFLLRQRDGMEPHILAGGAAAAAETGEVRATGQN